MNLPQTFSLTGLSCGSCVAKITTRLQQHPDIAEVTVTLDPAEARIRTAAPLSDADMVAWLAPLDNGRYQVVKSAVNAAPAALPAKNAQTYRPLIILLAYLLAIIAASAWAQGSFHLGEAMRLFMGGFFIAFSFFKLLDLCGFADAYRSYDLIAKAIPAYGFVYPFMELGLGLAYLANVQPTVVNAVTAVVMGVSLLGVLQAVLSKKTIRCACLGTVFNLPMSTVTIIEDALMVLMAIAALLLPH
ncbi:heavy-metal-associated domain-containing protein [Prosthecobacter dejongeii]|uniref:Copper chaperone CopZ n=1 Tax=Prosthecobacter dejongeii TaxID=48465 RepID=A0A7W7YM68_9BACT|nr:heavy metal-associated domain-containing protein [Prosthecobacter dejongeii]MBB5038783.1 copper chaperone CopZ [Prosthecobacter dejongeii]